MPATLKDFSELKSLRKDLKALEEARKVAEAERARRAQEVERDANLFRHSIGKIAPLAPVGKVHTTPPRPSPIARQHLADEQAALQESLSDGFSVETLMDTDDTLSFSRNGVGPDTLHKLRCGHWVMQDQLDLHGMRSDEAREALAAFLRTVCRQGLRCVRIIHGKGLGSVNKEPILKNKVHNWLAQKDEVIAFCQARAADGGAGALVVLLKAQNQSGKDGRAKER